MTEYGKLTFTTQKNGNLKGVLNYYDVNGKRRNISKTSKKKSKREAKKELEAWAQEMREQAKRGISLNSKKMGQTVEDVITRYINKQLETGKLERSTYSTQMNRIKRHVFPHIGAMTLQV